MPQGAKAFLRINTRIFQKEKDYGNTITKIGRKKNKKNETAKKKRKINNEMEENV